MLNAVSLMSMGATGLMLVCSGVLSRLLHKKWDTSNIEQWVMCWMIWDAMIHFLVEGPFVMISLTGTVQESQHFTGLLWKEYAKADSRWGVSDPTIVALEILTVFIVGPMCIATVAAICARWPSRHYIQLSLCVCELYGGWMTFVPDILVGSPSLATDNWLYLWVYLVFYNGVWVVVPALLMYQSWQSLVDRKQSNHISPASPTRGGSPYNLRKRNKVRLQ